MMEFLLLLISPVALIVMIILRLAKKINLPIGASTVLMIFVGVVCTFIATSIFGQELSNANPPIRCGMPLLAFTISGLFISIAVVPAMGCIGGSIWYFANKKPKPDPRPYQNY